jgi:hypothetical protein
LRPLSRLGPYFHFRSEDENLGQFSYIDCPEADQMAPHENHDDKMELNWWMPHWDAEHLNAATRTPAVVDDHFYMAMSDSRARTMFSPTARILSQSLTDSSLSIIHLLAPSPSRSLTSSNGNLDLNFNNDDFEIDLPKVPITDID